MALTVGTRLGTYDVLALIGAGGMGEVYRARDTKLNRDVALKVLPDAFTRDPDRVARFKREAQVLASLNHPHIATIYGLEEANGSQFLVLELVEGETLAAKLKSGPLPLNEALTVARQVADACQAAHEKGIVHRDLKPANIAFTPDEQVKVLDFGLAKVLEPDPRADLSNSPTLSLAATRAGVILGTAAYMAPEQARGKPVDKRADIWAFGAVLFEMLTGTPAFGGNEISDTLAFIITREPNWTSLPAMTPAAIHRLLRRCLEKDSKERLPEIGSARLDIKEALTTPATAGAVPPGAMAPRKLARVLPWAAAGALAAALAAVLVSSAPSRTAARAVRVQVSAALGADVSLSTLGGSAAILSPDGATLAFVAQKDDGAPQLYVRQMDQLQATPLSGTEGARDPFFSPDGQWIAFFGLGKLKKVSVRGGAAVTLCDAPNDRGGAWAEDGTIRADGGEPHMFKWSGAKVASK